MAYDKPNEYSKFKLQKIDNKKFYITGKSPKNDVYYNIHSMKQGTEVKITYRKTLEEAINHEKANLPPLPKHNFFGVKQFDVEANFKYSIFKEYHKY